MHGVGDWIKKRADDIGLQLKDVAVRSRVAPKTILNIRKKPVVREIGKRTKKPNDLTIAAIARVLQVDEDEMIDYVHGRGSEPSPVFTIELTQIAREALGRISARLHQGAGTFLSRLLLTLDRMPPHELLEFNARISAAVKEHTIGGRTNDTKNIPKPTPIEARPLSQKTAAPSESHQKPKSG